MRSNSRLAAAALTGVLALGAAAACGGSGGSTGNSGGNNNANSGTQSSAPATMPSTSPSPLAQISNLTGVHTQVILDSGFVKALQTLKLTPAPAGKATIKNGVATFPITGGNVTYYKPGTVDPYVQGIIHHNGSGISLTGGGTKVVIGNFDVDPGASMLYGKVTANGKVAAARAPLFFLNGSTLQPLQVNQSQGTAVLYGTKVYLSQAAAQLLNQTFKTNALSDQVLVGVAKITVKLPKS